MIRLCIVLLALSACSKSDPAVVADAVDADADVSEVQAVDVADDVTLADAATAATETAP